MRGSASDESDAVEQVTDAFVTELRAGQRPNIDDYLRRYPQFAEQLGELLPAIYLLEHHAAVCNLRNLERTTQAISLPGHEQIGDYTIVREIGRGGMGVVYEAVQQSLGRRVALKILSMPTNINAKHLERFHFEARAAARLQHSHIVPVFGVGEFNGLHYYAMQFICGKSLQEVLAAMRQTNGSALAASTSTNEPSATATQHNSREFHRNAARIGLQAAEALAYAHAEGVLHRDIKPSNLILDAKGSIWVTDFGLAKVEGTEGLTETGDFVGTLRYMAPERLDGVLDRRSDIYSLGATLYEMLTLQSFFETNSHARLVDQILNDSPPAPSRLERSIPHDLETIILKAIAKEPAARYRTAEDMAEDLRRFLADRPILSRRPAASEQFVRWCRRNPLVATLAGTVVVLLVAAVVILTYSNARIRSETVAKDKALASARDAVHQLLTRVASEKLNNMPVGHPLRLSLLEDAMKAYEGLVALGDTDLAMREQMADVLHSMAGLQRELGRSTDAASALQRCARLYESLVPADPNPPAISEVLASVEADLAYTWQFDTQSPKRPSFPIEDQYRRALSIYEDIERRWPDRREPVTLCLRSLADLAHRHGDKEAAEQLWRDSISRGEAYLEQRPGNLQVRNELCWACISYYEAKLSATPDRYNEADVILATGVKHAEIMRQQKPESTQATDILAALHFRQALVCCRDGRIDEAIPIFQKATQEIESLCESVPWNTDYWNTAQWFQQDSIQNLQKAGRTDAVDALLGQTATWLRKVAANDSADELTRRKLTEMRSAYINLLRSIGRDREADEFVDVVK